MSEDKSAWLEWADFLGSTGGGFVVAILAWLTLSEPCQGPLGLSVECVQFGAVQYSLADVVFGVPLIAAGIGMAIHLARS